MAGQPSGDEGDEITITFDKDACTSVSSRTLEAVSPVLKTILYECQFDCSLMLSKDSMDAWMLILNYVDPDHMPCDVSNIIECVSPETIVNVVRMCHAYEITSLEEEIDKITAQGIEAMDPCSPRQPRARELDYIHVDLKDRFFEIVRQTEMVKSERALARYLVQVIKTNEKRVETRVARGMSTDEEEWESAMERIHGFIKKMHNTKRYRFCSFFAERCMSERVNTSLFSIFG